MFSIEVTYPSQLLSNLSATKKLAALAGVSLALVTTAVAPAPANAFTITVDAIKYEIAIVNGFNTNQATLEAAPWWTGTSSSDLANTFAQAFTTAYTPNPFTGSLLFAYRTLNQINGQARAINASGSVGNSTFNRAAASNQFASVVSSTPIPGPLPVIGALAAFGWSRRMRKSIRLAQAPSIGSSD